MVASPTCAEGLSYGFVGPNMAGPSSVTEIDPAGMDSVLALVAGVLGLFERRRLTMKRAARERSRASGGEGEMVPAPTNWREPPPSGQHASVVFAVA